MAIEKIKIPGAVLELSCTANSAPLDHFLVNGLDWQCYLAGSSKPAPQILIFSIARGANYSFELNSNETYAPNFVDIIIHS